MVTEKISKYTGEEFIKEMENKYGSSDEAEKLFERTKDMRILVDIRNWKYFKNHLTERIKITESHFES
ncbi:hypothetical protein [Methanobrevibacter sp.]|uniref:hypothetical protein n=1 Tax=Methanobrevibacter sp. TaxID=66852 RepID=UPI00386EB186